MSKSIEAPAAGERGGRQISNSSTDSNSITTKENRPRCDDGVIVFTQFTSQNSKPVGKLFRIEDGELTKTTNAFNLCEAIAKWIAVRDAGGFVDYLKGLQTNQALAYGVLGHDVSTILSRAKLKQAGDTDAIARTRENFSFRDGEPEIMLLDYDPRETSLTKEELLNKFYQICPAAEDTAHVWGVSSSSCIQIGKEQLVGIRGQRIYLLVLDASDIPRAGEVLHKRAWLWKFGYYDISKSGCLLERALFDRSVYQPERLDFCGGASCHPPLEQRRPEPEVFGDGLLDTRKAFPDLTAAEESNYVALKAEAKAAIRPEQERARNEYIEREAGKLSETKGIEIDSARRQVRIACEESRLFSDFILYPEHGEPVTVGEICDNPSKWHNTRFADPLEPGYGNDKRIAWLNAYTGGRPILYSHAHGGRCFKLYRQRNILTIAEGSRPELVDKIIEVLQTDPALFERGSGVNAELTALTGSHLLPQCKYLLADRIDRLVTFQSIKKKQLEPVPKDCPLEVAELISRKRGQLGLRTLKGIVTAPTLRLDGSLVSTPGYDCRTGLLLLNNDNVDFSVPKKPSRNQIEAALKFVWRPFALFPWVNEIARAVFFSALITAVIRKTLPTAPGFLLDAPIAASGKTLLAKCLSILSGESIPSVQPADGRDAAEIRKSLLASLRSDYGCIIFDNAERYFRNTALCAFLTARYYADRILGVSSTIALPNTALFLVTGNNVVPVGDLYRRLLAARIDPKMETPYRREFKLNPESYVTQHRVIMVRALLTLVRGYRSSGMGRVADGRTASFEEWDDLVRQTVCWISQEFPDMKLADPIESISGGKENDPDTQQLKSLLHAWYNQFDDTFKTVAGVVVEVKLQTAKSLPGALYYAIDEIAAENGEINRKKLGQWLGSHVGQIVDDLYIKRGNTTSGGSAQWGVRKITKLKR